MMRYFYGTLSMLLTTLETNNNIHIFEIWTKMFKKIKMFKVLKKLSMDEYSCWKRFL